MEFEGILGHLARELNELDEAKEINPGYNTVIKDDRN